MSESVIDCTAVLLSDFRTAGRANSSSAMGQITPSYTDKPSFINTAQENFLVDPRIPMLQLKRVVGAGFLRRNARLLRQWSERHLEEAPQVMQDSTKMKKAPKPFHLF